MITILISFDIVMRTHLSAGMKAVYIVGIFVLQTNDYCRNTYPLFRRNRMLYYVSMAAGIAATGFYLIQFDSLAISIYYIFPVVEIFLTCSTIQIGMLIFHAMVFLFTMYTLKANPENALFSYLSMFVLVFMFRVHSDERKKGQLLTTELVAANAKLKEITIVKERTRIAQELHDSIGHGLVALRMHLEFAGNMVDTDPQKSKEVMTKALTISHKSITDLRKAVAVLKENSFQNNMELGESLKEMVDALQMKGRLNILLHVDEAVEYTNLDIKKGIYNTVREAMTNGLKHGKAEHIQIHITKYGNRIRVTIENDGEGCKHIVKSHGLIGIEERIRSLDGTVQFSSTKDRGFAILAEMPYVTGTENF
ncbi:sensor histidine kinase [Paenibacillus sp. N3.4]|uniref:sensor histidine kinase n=1 Tax=Paenibacillus sp. N3.4 TaxID=2603222 RepID=UPI001C9D3323|nr:sensor histidine kinase [Paenibacillus sp. N3.4]